MPLDLKAADTAAEILFKARRDDTRLDLLPEAIRPITASDGYAVQAGVVDRMLAAHGGNRIGYKIGATNAAAREMLGAREAFAGVRLSAFANGIRFYYYRPFGEALRLLVYGIWLRLGRGYAWFDAGTHESLLQAGEFVRTIQQRQGFQIACLEEIAYRLGYIDNAALETLAEPLLKTDYGRYLLQVLDEQGPRDWAKLG